MTGTYRLTCTTCSYGERAEGLEDAYDLAETHRRRQGEAHFVEMAVVADGDGVSHPSDGTTPQSAGPPRSDDAESDGTTSAADD